MKDKLRYLISKFCSIINNHDLSKLTSPVMFDDINLVVNNNDISSFEVKQSSFNGILDHTKVSMKCTSSSRNIEYIIDNNVNMTSLEKTAKEIFDLLLKKCESNCFLNGIPYSYKKEIESYCNRESIREPTEDYCSTYSKSIIYIPLILLSVIGGLFAMKKVYNCLVKRSTEEIITKKSELNDDTPFEENNLDTASSISSYTSDMNHAVGITIINDHITNSNL